MYLHQNRKASLKEVDATNKNPNEGALIRNIKIDI